MRKKILIVLPLVLIISSGVVYAHVTGAFKDYLVGVSDKTTVKLSDEIEQTKKDIEKLAPQEAQQEKDYDQKESVATTKLKFYDAMGMDTFAAFVAQSQNITDVFANDKILENNIQEYLGQLNQLYLTYQETKTTKETMQEYQELLKIIQDNLAARDKYTQSLSIMLNPTDATADLIGGLWETRASQPLTKDIQSDNQMISKDISSLLTQDSPDAPYYLTQSVLNQHTKLKYYIRSDHIYVHYVKGEADVILIGVMGKSSDTTANLTFEAGFINGYMLPSDKVQQIPGFAINYKKIKPDSKGFYIEQINGKLAIQPEETSQRE